MNRRRNPDRGRYRRRLVALALFCAPLLAQAEWLTPDGGPATDVPVAPGAPKLVLIIDDLGNELQQGHRSIELPGRVTLSVLPHTPYARELAEQAHAMGHEVMLHAPMSDLGHRPLGPGALTTEQSEEEFRSTLANALRQVPYVRGLNNHMGSKLTQLPLQMDWLMQELGQRGLYFVDSRTSAASVAASSARRAGLPHLSRNVFLDNVRQREAIHERFEHALRLAGKRGLAVVIAHPTTETLDYLQETLPTLPLRGVRMLYASEALQAASVYSRTSMPRSAM